MEKGMVTVYTQAYNVGEYMIQCIESVLGQTYKNFEWILVENGSTDNTGEIIQAYAEKDSRIRYICHNVNKKGFANDYICHYANGEYIAKLDSDDFWESRYLEKLVNAMETSGADLACCKAIVLDEINNKKYYHGFRKFEGVITTENIAAQYGEIEIDMNAYWAKLMRQDLFKKAKDSCSKLRGVKCKSGYAGDTIFMYCYLVECSKSVYLTDALYVYRLHRKNTSKTEMSPTVIENCLVSYEVKRKFLKKNCAWGMPNSALVYKAFWEDLDTIFRNMIQADTIGNKQKIEAVSKILSDDRVREIRKEYCDGQIRKLLSAHIAWCYVNLEEGCEDALWNMLEVLDPEMFSEITEEQRPILRSDREWLALFILGDQEAALLHLENTAAKLADTK